MSFALLRLARQGWDAPLLGQIHDAYLGMSREQDLERDVSRVKQEMERPVWIADRFAVLPAEAKYARVWSQLKKAES
jgi:hypothetical protein